MERPGPNTPSPEEQLRQIGEANERAWAGVVSALQQATFEYIEVSDEERQLLNENFWAVHSAVLERAELFQPGVARAIFDRAELIGQERRQHEMDVFENETLPKIKRSAFLRGLIGLPPKNLDVY